MRRIPHLFVMSLLLLSGCQNPFLDTYETLDQPLEDSLVFSKWVYTPASSQSCTPQALRLDLAKRSAGAPGSNVTNMTATWQQDSLQARPAIGGVVDLTTGRFSIALSNPNPLVTLVGMIRGDGTASAEYFSSVCGEHQMLGARE
jgi:hypothetical protein